MAGQRRRSPHHPTAPDAAGADPTEPGSPEHGGAAADAPAAAGDETTLAAGEASETPRRERGTASYSRGDHVGRYVILDVIGDGGMGIVYAAYDPELDRKVALKLLHRVVGGTEGRARLVREAQAMARLAHPNVIAVHDVGTAENDVFIAMEYVAGPTLRSWLRSEQPGISEILGVFEQAGRGLAAAHAAGLVHRDFKPENALVADGRVRVLDFGLARAAAHGGSTSGPAPRRGGAEESPNQALEESLTVTGNVVGTPAYMAPEQQEGARTDARADQFAFCVALYEAIFGLRPYTGTNRAELLDNIRAKRLREPERRDVPAPVWRTLKRGLSPRPEDRYPTMDALLAELRPPSAGRRRPWIAAAAAAAALAGTAAIGVFALGDDEAAVCSGAPEEFARVWSDVDKGAVEDALLAVDRPYVEAVWNRASTDLDAYGERWIDERERACRATRVTGEQSTELLDRRMACLDRRLGAARAVVEVLSRADEDIAQRAVTLVSELPPPAACSRVGVLAADVRPPAEEERARVETLRAHVDEGRALIGAGKYREALETLEPALEAAEELDYAPIRAELGFRLANAHTRLGHLAEAKRHASRALRAAEVGGHRVMAVRAAEVLGLTIGYYDYEREQGLRWVHLARAKAKQLGDGHEALLGDILSSLATIEHRHGNWNQSLEHHEEALAIHKEVYGEEHHVTATSLNNMANVYGELGDYEKAETYYRRALSIRESLLGKEHPYVGTSLTNLGWVLRDRGRYDEAIEHYERALAIREPALGREHAQTAMTLNNLANAYKERGDVKRGRELHEEALAIRERLFGEEHPHVGMSLHNLAEIAIDRGNLERALTLLDRAHSIFDSTLGPEHPHLGYVLTARGRALLKLGRLHDAIASLERALSIREGADAANNYLGETRFELARALWRRGDRERALATARRARADYASFDNQEERVAELDAWLNERSP